MSILMYWCLVLSCLVLSCLALPCLVLPCLALPCLALSCLVLSWCVPLLLRCCIKYRCGAVRVMLLGVHTYIHTYIICQDEGETMYETYHLWNIAHQAALTAHAPGMKTPLSRHFVTDILIILPTQARDKHKEFEFNQRAVSAHKRFCTRETALHAQPRIHTWNWQDGRWDLDWCRQLITEPFWARFFVCKTRSFAKTGSGRTNAHNKVLRKRRAFPAVSSAGDISVSWEAFQNTPATVLRWGLAGAFFVACDTVR
jgi:hypothetical protein